jgi:crossover junction endodeoxyribonuclease RuvC
MVKIVGIDPGLAATGIGIVWGGPTSVAGYAHGTIRTPKTDRTAHRLEQIHEKLTKVLRQETPDLMIVEDIFSLGKYPKSSILLGKVAGVVLLAGAQAGIPALEVQVRAVKQVLTGNGNASKEQVETAVRRHLNLEKPLRPLHVSDAMALAILGLFRFQTLKSEGHRAGGGGL